MICTDDLVNPNNRDITHENQILARAVIVQRKTRRPMQFGLTEPTKTAVATWIAWRETATEYDLVLR